MRFEVYLRNTFNCILWYFRSNVVNYQSINQSVASLDSKPSSFPVHRPCSYQSNEHDQKYSNVSANRLQATDKMKIHTDPRQSIRCCHDPAYQGRSQKNSSASARCQSEKIRPIPCEAMPAQHSLIRPTPKCSHEHLNTPNSNQLFLKSVIEWKRGFVNCTRRDTRSVQ